MLVYWFWLLGLLLIVIQTTLLQYLPSWIGRPDFVFIFVTFIAYRFAWIPGIALVFSIGWILDVIAGIHLGFYPLMCLITFSLLKLFSDKNPVKEATYQIPLVGISYFLVQISFYVIFSVIEPEILPEWSWGITLQRTILVVVAAIPLYLLFSFFYEHIKKRRLRVKPPKRRQKRTR